MCLRAQLLIGTLYTNERTALVDFPQTGFDRKQNDGTNESLLYKPIATFRALSKTRHAPDDVLRTGRSLSDSGFGPGVVYRRYKKQKFQYSAVTWQISPGMRNF